MLARCCPRRNVAVLADRDPRPPRDRWPLIWAALKRSPLQVIDQPFEDHSVLRFDVPQLPRTVVGKLGAACGIRDGSCPLAHATPEADPPADLGEQMQVEVGLAVIPVTAGRLMSTSLNSVSALDVGNANRRGRRAPCAPAPKLNTVFVRPA